MGPQLSSGTPGCAVPGAVWGPLVCQEVTGGDRRCQEVAGGDRRWQDTVGMHHSRMEMGNCSCTGTG